MDQIKTVLQVQYWAAPNDDDDDADPSEMDAVGLVYFEKEDQTITIEADDVAENGDKVCFEINVHQLFIAVADAMLKPIDK